MFRAITSPVGLPNSPDRTRWLRNTPSNEAPMRSMAVRLRVFRSSVQMATRHTPNESNAWVSNNNFASVLIGVRWAAAPSHVPPISTSSGAGRLRHQ